MKCLEIIMADIAITVNQALLDAAEWAEVSVWVVITVIAVAALIALIFVFYCVKHRQEPLIKIYTEQGEAGDDALEFVEKTLAEFPADRIKIEASKGKVVIKLVSVKAATEKEAEEDVSSKQNLPQEVKGEPLPTIVEEPASEEQPQKSEPIPMGTADSAPGEKESK